MGFIVGILISICLYALNPRPFKVVVKWMVIVGIAGTVLGKIVRAFISRDMASDWNAMAMFHLLFLISIPAVLVVGAIIGVVARKAASNRSKNA